MPEYEIKCKKMKQKQIWNSIITISSIIILLTVSTILYILFPKNESGIDTVAIDAYTADQPCTPTFKDGGGPYYEPNTPFRDDIAPSVNTGDRLIVSGRLYESDCLTPIAHGVIDIWQASEEGNYEAEWYRGQITTDSQGYYSFSTVIPLGYGEGTAYRPPHIHFKVHINGIEQITSQMFFPIVRGTPGFDEAYIMHLEKEDDAYYGYHNIILP